MISTKRLGAVMFFGLLLAGMLRADDSSSGRKSRFEGFSVGYEARHDRLRFEFHNPVTSGGLQLIPHYFVQTYTADNQWGVLRGKYSLLNISWETEFGVTPQRTNYGDDYDTSYELSGDVSVAGTFGNVSMRSYRFLQRGGLAKVKGVLLSFAYEYQLERARFQFGNSFELHSNPPSSIYEKLPIQETTKSRFHRFEAGGRREWSLSPHWRFSADVSVSPTTLAFLTVILPAKYPGEELVFLSKAIGFSSRLALRSDAGRFPVEVYAAYGRDWSYTRGELRREFFCVGASIGTPGK